MPPSRRHKPPFYLFIFLFYFLFSFAAADCVSQPLGPTPRIGGKLDQWDTWLVLIRLEQESTGVFGMRCTRFEICWILDTRQQTCLARASGLHLRSPPLRCLSDSQIKRVSARRLCLQVLDDGSKFPFVILIHFITIQFQIIIFIILTLFIYTFGTT